MGGVNKPLIANNRKVRYFILRTTSLHLVAEHLSARLLSLGLVDVLHQYALVFEDISLGFLVQGMVPFVSQSDDEIKQNKNRIRYAQMLVNLSTFTIFP
jgi:hypothetical protein